MQEYLDDFEWSLFKVEPEFLEPFLKKHEEGEPYVDDCDRNVRAYEVAANLILKRETPSVVLNDNLEELIRQDLEKEPTNVHVCRNRVMLYLLKKDKEQARAAMESLKKALKDSVAMEMAKVDYAYWYAERVRDQEAWEESHKILASVESNSALKEHPGFDLVLHRSKLIHRKILIRYLKTSFVFDKCPSWHIEHLKVVFGLLKDLRGAPLPVTSPVTLRDKEKENWFWLWLGETLLLKSFFKYQDALASEIEQVARLEKMNPRDIRPDWWLEKVIEHSEGEPQVNEKILARAGKLCLSFALKRCDGDDEAYKRLAKLAIERSERALAAAPTPLYMALQTKADAHLSLWALDYYNNRSTRRLAIKERDELFGNCPGRQLVLDYPHALFINWWKA